MINKIVNHFTLDNSPTQAVSHCFQLDEPWPHHDRQRMCKLIHGQRNGGRELLDRIAPVTLYAPPDSTKHPMSISFILHWAAGEEKKLFHSNNDGIMSPVCIQSGAMKVGALASGGLHMLGESERSTGAKSPSSALIIQEKRKKQTTG